VSTKPSGQHRRRRRPSREGNAAARHDNPNVRADTISSVPDATPLATRVRLADGRSYSGPLAAHRHQAIQLGLLHQHSAGLMELAAGPRPAGAKVQITSRNDPASYLPAGLDGGADWLARALAHVAASTARARHEAFVGVAPRTRASANKTDVAHSRWLWVDVDEPEELGRLWALLARRPAHLVI